MPQAQAGYATVKRGNVTGTGPGARASASNSTGYRAEASVGGWKTNDGIAELKSASASAGISSKGMSARATGAEAKLTDAISGKLLTAGGRADKDGLSVGASLAEANLGPVGLRAGLKGGIDKDGVHMGPVSLKFW